jgi:hypothetical protein
MTGKEVERFTVAVWPWLTQLAHWQEPEAQEHWLLPEVPQWLARDDSARRGAREVSRTYEQF